MRLDFLGPAVLIFMTACGGDDDDDGSTVDAGGEPDASAVADAGDEADSGTTATLCGGLLGLQCDDTHYCDWEDGSCGVGDVLGACMPLPTGCPPGEPSVCGCDGQIYKNACLAAMARVDVAE